MEVSSEKNKVMVNSDEKKWICGNFVSSTDALGLVAKMQLLEFKQTFPSKIV